MPTCVDWPREWICEKNKITFTRFRHNSSHMQWQSDWHDKLIRFRNRFNAIIFSTVNAILGPLDAGVSNLFSLRATSELDCGRRGGVGGVYLYLLITMHCRYQILVSSEIISSKSTLANCNSFFHIPWTISLSLSPLKSQNTCQKHYKVCILPFTHYHISLSSLQSQNLSSCQPGLLLNLSLSSRTGPKHKMFIFFRRYFFFCWNEVDWSVNVKW